MSNNTKTLGEISEIISKGTTPTSVGLNYASPGIAFLRGEDVLGGEVNSRTVARHISTEAHTVLRRSALKSGDVLITIAGTIGRIGFVGVKAPDLNCNQAVSFARIKPHIADPAYICFALQTPRIQSIFAEFIAGGAIPNVNLEQIRSIKIFVPSLIEQIRIAADLSAQLAAADEARQAAQSQLKDSKRLIPALLSATFEHLDDAEWRPIGAVAKTTSGTTPSRGQKDLWEPPLHPWIKTGEVAFKTINQTEESVSAKALAECSLTLLPAGTVLVAMYGQGKTRGQSALLNVAATTNQACFAILPSAALDPEYLQFWLRHSYEALRSLSDSRGGNQSNLNGALMNAFEVPLLPLEKQQTIARHLKQAIADANALQQTIEQQLREIELLPSRLLAQFFDTQGDNKNDE